MISQDLEIRSATRAEFNIVVDWAADEGWNPGLGDGDIFHATDPDGFLIGFLYGAPVAAISVVTYGRSFGFLGFYIVRPQYRGEGFGIRIWQAGMARLAGRTVGLDGVIDQQDNYRKSGFAFAHRNIRYGGIVAESGETDAKAIDAAEVPFDALSAYDAPFFAAPRSEFLARWVNAPGHIAKISCRDGRITGYGVCRPCRDGAKIGPLYADDPETADGLFRGLAASVPDGLVFLDVAEPNAGAVALAERYQLQPSFETARMYAGRPLGLPLDRIYGISTFELG